MRVRRAAFTAFCQKASGYKSTRVPRLRRDGARARRVYYAQNSAAPQAALTLFIEHNIQTNVPLAQHKAQMALLFHCLLLSAFVTYCVGEILLTHDSEDHSSTSAPDNGRTKQVVHNELVSMMLATNDSVRLDTPPLCTHLVNYSASPIPVVQLEGDDLTLRSELIVITELLFEQILSVVSRDLTRLVIFHAQSNPLVQSCVIYKAA